MLVFVSFKILLGFLLFLFFWFSSFLWFAEEFLTKRKKEIISLFLSEEEIGQHFRFFWLQFCIVTLSRWNELSHRNRIMIFLWNLSHPRANIWMDLLPGQLFDRLTSWIFSYFILVHFSANVFEWPWICLMRFGSTSLSLPPAFSILAIPCFFVSFFVVVASHIPNSIPAKKGRKMKQKQKSEQKKKILKTSKLKISDQPKPKQYEFYRF